MSENPKKINWYPGHMAKTKRLLQDQIRRIDLVMEVCDARLPYSSRNPELKTLAAGKKHLLFLMHFRWGLPRSSLRLWRN